MDIAKSTGDKEQLSTVIERDFIHLKFEGFFSCFVISSVHKCDEIFFVPHCYCVAVRSPTNVDVLS